MLEVYIPKSFTIRSVINPVPVAIYHEVILSAIAPCNAYRKDPANCRRAASYPCALYIVANFKPLGYGILNYAVNVRYVAKTIGIIVFKIVSTHSFKRPSVAVS